MLDPRDLEAQLPDSAAQVRGVRTAEVPAVLAQSVEALDRLQKELPVRPVEPLLERAPPFGVGVVADLGGALEGYQGNLAGLPCTSQARLTKIVMEARGARLRPASPPTSEGSSTPPPPDRLESGLCRIGARKSVPSCPRCPRMSEHGRQPPGSSVPACPSCPLRSPAARAATSASQAECGAFEPLQPLHPDPGEGPGQSSRPALVEGWGYSPAPASPRRSRAPWRLVSPCASRDEGPRRHRRPSGPPDGA